jgi:hypothetical protein
MRTQKFSNIGAAAFFIVDKISGSGWSVWQSSHLGGQSKGSSAQMSQGAAAVLDALADHALLLLRVLLMALPPSAPPFFSSLLES